ncbi:hypothetical protein [Nitrosopumilus sp.]|uniref:hypothetical protein n=1 Tax=Nitrosopumilus sp. TaxID=2024843 RepID=UPI00349FF9FF
MNKFKLKRMLNLESFESFYRRTYTFDFAKRRFHQEIRYDLIDLRKLLEILTARRGDFDEDILKSITLINDFLEKTTLHQKKPSKLNKILWTVVNSSIVSSLALPWITSAEQYYPIILMVGVMIAMPFGSWYMGEKLTNYIIEKLWYRTCNEQLGIPKLREELTKKLILEINI